MVTSKVELTTIEHLVGARDLPSVVLFFFFSGEREQGQGVEPPIADLELLLSLSSGYFLLVLGRPFAR